MIILKIIAGFLKALNAKESPRAVAGGFALGAIIGLTPTGSLHNVAVLLLIFILPVNKSASIVSALILSLVGLALDPLTDPLGHFLLTLPALQGLWTALYNTPVVPWSRFNNTVVLGSLTLSLALLWPLYRGGTWAVEKYRDRVVTVIAKWKLVHLIKASKFYAIYEKIS